MCINAGKGGRNKMERQVIFFDTTLRDGEQTPNVSLNAGEKLEIAKQLARLGVDVIEAGFPISSKGEFDAVKLISGTLKNNSVAALSRAVKKDIDVAWDAIGRGYDPRLHIVLATSDIHIEHKLKASRAGVLEQAAASVSYAKSLCTNVQFSAEDAFRSDPAYLCEVLAAVIKAGATTVNIPDTVGYITPLEIGGFFEIIRRNVPNLGDAVLSVHYHDDLGLAVANSLASVEKGAGQVECCINGVGERAGNASLEEILMGLEVRKSFYGVRHNLNTQEIMRTSRLVSKLMGIGISPTKAIVGANAFSHESGIHQHGVLAEPLTYEIMKPESIGLSRNSLVLGKSSGKHAFEEKVRDMGFLLKEEEIAKAFQKFKNLADKKKEILDADIIAIVEEESAEIPVTYELEMFQVSSGNKSTSTATVSLKKEDGVSVDAAVGSGSVDALFHAVDRATGISVELKSYGLKAVTEGKDAQGEVMVRVEYEKRVFVGRGVSIDILEASVRAYLAAINKILYYQEMPTAQ